MNLYDTLRQKMYSNILYNNGSDRSSRHLKVADHSSTDDDNEYDEDGENEKNSCMMSRLGQRRKAKVFPRHQPLAELTENIESEPEEDSLQRTYTNGTAMSEWDNTLQCQNDLFLRQNYEKYQFLKKRPNQRKTIAEHRAFFDELLGSINRIKLIIGPMAVLFLSYSLSLDLLTMPSLTATTRRVKLGVAHFELNRLLPAASFAALCLFLAIGFRLGCIFSPSRNRFRLQYDNTFFIIFLDFIAFALLEFTEGILVVTHLTLFLPLLVSLKALLAGFLAVYLLYALFDSQIVVVEREEAKRYVRTFLFDLLAGLILALATPTIGDQRRSLISLLTLCRVYLATCFAVVFLILWYGIAQLDDHTIINNRNRSEFGFYFDIRAATSGQSITLDCICFAVQNARRFSDHLAGDNCSVRTVKPWRQNCLTFVGVVLFVSALQSMLFYLVFSFVWADKFFAPYSEYWQGFLARWVFVSCLLVLGTFLESRISSLLIDGYNRYRRSPLEPPVRSNAARLHFLKLVIFYLLAIMAYLAQLYCNSFGFGLMLVMNATLGVSIGSIFDYVPRFIAKFITITAITVRLAVVGSIAYCSITAMFVHHLVTRTGSGLAWLYYLNLITAIISLILVVGIAKLPCLRSTNSFDLVAMKRLVAGKKKIRPPTPPPFRRNSVKLQTKIQGFKPQDVSSFSQHNSSSASSYYLYQVAVDGTSRVSEHMAEAGPPPAVIPYSFHLRIASLASILSFRKNS